MYDAFFKILGFLLPFIAPQLLMIGIALLVYDFWTVGAGVGFVIAGSIVMIITVLVLVFSEKNHRRRKKRYLKIPILVGISIFGLFEFIVGLILTDGISRYDGFGLVIRLMTVGAGSIIAFPALIYLIIVIVETILGKNSSKSPKSQISPVSDSPALSSEVRRSIHLLFEHEYDEIEPTLTTMLTEGIADKKLIVLSELGKLKNKKSSTLVLNALVDENKYVRRRAAEVLGKIGVTQQIEPMKIIAQKEKDPQGDIPRCRRR